MAEPDAPPPLVARNEANQIIANVNEQGDILDADNQIVDRAAFWVPNINGTTNVAMNIHFAVLVALSDNLFTANGVGLRIFNAVEDSRRRGRAQRTYEAAGRAVLEGFVRSGGIPLYLDAIARRLKAQDDANNHRLVVNNTNTQDNSQRQEKSGCGLCGIIFVVVVVVGVFALIFGDLSYPGVIMPDVITTNIERRFCGRGTDNIQVYSITSHNDETVLKTTEPSSITTIGTADLNDEMIPVNPITNKDNDDTPSSIIEAKSVINIGTADSNDDMIPVNPIPNKDNDDTPSSIIEAKSVTNIGTADSNDDMIPVNPIPNKDNDDTLSSIIEAKSVTNIGTADSNDTISVNPIPNKDNDVSSSSIIEAKSVTNIGTADSNGTISVNPIPNKDNDVSSSSIIEATSNKEDAHSITDPTPVATIGMADLYKESDATDYSVSVSNVVTNKEENDTIIDPTAGTAIGMVDPSKKIEVAIDSSAVGSNVVANTDDIDTLTDPTAGTTIGMVDPNKKMDDTEAGSNVVTNDGGGEDLQKEIERDDSSAGANIAHEEDNGVLLSLSADDAIEMSFLMSFGDTPKNGSMRIRTSSEEYLGDDFQPLSSPPRDDNNEANDETIFELPSLGGENFGDSNQLSSDPTVDEYTPLTCPIKVDSHDPPFPTLPNLTLSQRFNESHFANLTLPAPTLRSDEQQEVLPSRIVEEPSSIVEEPYECTTTLSNMFCHDTCGNDTFSSSYLEVYHDHEHDLNAMIDHGMSFISDYCCYDSNNINGTSSMIFDELMYDYYNTNTLFGSLRSDAVTEDAELMTVIDDRMSMVSGTAATDDLEDKTTLFDNYGMTLMFDHCCYDSNMNGTSSIMFDELMRDHYKANTSFVFLRSDTVTEDTELVTVMYNQVIMMPDTATADHEDKTTLFDDYGMTLMFDHCCYDGDINGVSSLMFEKTVTGNGNRSRFDADNIANSSTSDDNNGPSAFQSGVYFEYITTLVLDLVYWFKKTFTGNGNRGVNDDLFTFESINSASDVLWNVFVVIAKIIAFFIVFIFFGCWYLPRFLWWAEGIVCGLVDWEQIFYQPVLNHREKIIWVYNLFQRVGAFCCKPLIAMNRIIQIRRGPMNNAQELQHLDDDDDNNYM